MSILSLLKEAAPLVKPLAIKLGKDASVGILGSLVSKYAYRLTGNYILSQRDRDIQTAAENSGKLAKLIKEQNDTLIAHGGSDAVQTIAKDAGYVG
jgi:hypothetical protein